MPAEKTVIEICLGSSCFSRGNKDIVKIVQDIVAKQNPGVRITLRGTRCTGHCSNGPNIVINGKIIEGVSISDIEEILSRELGIKRI
ncbi:MAG TPA: NAD(P)H-dependent oxidoreductase subunit E [Bacteroidales bacterium]|nr:NAD(P)H-dependent oxidoreductase subunit E [Bacteroidales bacterium]HRR94120.1 NAD(P)H-dependent oxidoreductase subunit E [Bacteroidales bacterium]HRT89374.1 NAD(P)H-dependent oxidoreductase subunit E [Bacteroidales bacterium]